MSELAAKRWAKALIELAQEDNNISKEDILDDLKEVVANIDASAELSNAINNPSISTEEKQVIICKLFQNRVMPIVYNFLYALNLKKRLSLISDITSEFQTELEKIKNIVHIDITSAIDLDDEKKLNIRNKLAEKLQKDIMINWNKNAKLLADLFKY